MNARRLLALLAVATPGRAAAHTVGERYDLPLPVDLYILGGALTVALSFAVIVSRVFGLADPRSYGSGNPGATNVLRSGNKAAAILTLLFDALKGYVPVIVAWQLGLPELAVKWYRRALESPSLPEEQQLGLLYDLGTALLAAGDRDAAYKAFVDIYGVNSNYRDVVARLEELGRR